MAIRRSRPEDAAALGELSSLTYKSTYAGMFGSDGWLADASAEYFSKLWAQDLAEQEERGPVLVAEEGGKLVGLVSAKWLGERGDFYTDLGDDVFHELCELYVLKEMQGNAEHHFGSALLYEMVKLFDRKKKIVAHAAAKNKGIRDYMKKLGAEAHVSGTLTIFQSRRHQVKEERVSFYWDVETLLNRLAEPRSRALAKEARRVIRKAPNFRPDSSR
jgi:hypothetical protein